MEDGVVTLSTGLFPGLHHTVDQLNEMIGMSLTAFNPEVVDKVVSALTKRKQQARAIESLKEGSKLVKVCKICVPLIRSLCVQPLAAVPLAELMQRPVQHLPSHRIVQRASDHIFYLPHPLPCICFYDRRNSCSVTIRLSASIMHRLDPAPFFPLAQPAFRRQPRRPLPRTWTSCSPPRPPGSAT